MPEKSNPKLFFLGALGFATFLPVFRSGGRTGLSLWGWIINHTIWGPPVEYVPEEDYARELEGVKITSHVERLPPSSIEGTMRFYKISEVSARKLLSR